ncbi:MAG: hypothetical protein NTY44_09480, partial [Deltaproteobacteria bacterium]|nr:hypothetical protein [Deltaproteobacteria bacterium]
PYQPSPKFEVLIGVLKQMGIDPAVEFIAPSRLHGRKGSHLASFTLDIEEDRLTCSSFSTISSLWNRPTNSRLL